jgi:hypothetical protein
MNSVGLRVHTVIKPNLAIPECMAHFLKWTLFESSREQQITQPICPSASLVQYGGNADSDFSIGAQTFEMLKRNGIISHFFVFYKLPQTFKHFRRQELKPIAPRMQR